jgi:hypothetical protein
MADKHRQLYDQLKADGYYSKSYDEFIKQFANPEKLVRLHGLMQADGLYTKSVDDFKQQFFALPPKQDNKSTTSDSTQYQKINLRDERKIEQATGVPLSDKSRFHAEIDIQHIQQVVASARKHGVDPYTALAMNLAETRFSPEWKSNPFHLGNYDPQGDVIDESMKVIAEKNKYAKGLGKKKEADIIQAYNGYGSLVEQGNMYGIDTAKNPIEMSTNPVYGKRIIDLRENVIKQNPGIKGIVDSVLASNPQNDYKFWPNK